MENKIQITVSDSHGRHEIEAVRGARLFDILTENGFYTAAFCGGNGICGKCTVKVNGVLMLSCRTFAEDGMNIELPNAGGNILSVSGVEQTGELLGKPIFVLDIGTTTLALALVDSESGRAAEVFTANNPQAKYGADVISRIGYCSNGGLSALHSSITDAVNSMLQKACEKYSVESAETLYAAGNTVMLHLFLNTDCSSMGYAPYTPAFLEAREVKAAEIGIERAETVCTLPCFSSFVGGDIAAGLLAAPKPKSGKYSLLFDLGTNAEIALFSEDEILCTSAAAGPCFEGANITCGMSATSGAVSAFKIKDGKKEYKTVGGAPAKGICGTGLIDIIAELLKSGELDETGCLEEDEPYEIAENVYIYQKDIREFQVAKSAVRSAAEILLKRAEIGCDDIETLYLSGGFSSFIDIPNAAFCGLFPEELTEKCRAIQNSSLYGAIKYALGSYNPQEFTEKCRYIDLNADPEFSEKFMQNISFDALDTE